MLKQTQRINKADQAEVSYEEASKASVNKWQVWASIKTEACLKHYGFCLSNPPSTVRLLKTIGKGYEGSVNGIIFQTSQNRITGMWIFIFIW